MQVGGTPAIDTPVYQPVVSINCFAMKSGSANPPWGQANQLAEQIRLATYARRVRSEAGVLVTMPAGYGQALVLSVYPVSEPRRIPSDPSSYAVYNLDLQFNWTAASEVLA